MNDKIGVRRFLKQFACKNIYLDQFYFKLSNVKFMDVCFKHFLGRAILDHQEMQVYNNILVRKGVGELIIAMLDSEEYRKAFGCFTVPYPRKYQYYQSPEAFLESKLLDEEHVGQRGQSVPTIYWRQLGLTCTNGVCRHPEEDQIFTTTAKPEPVNSSDVEMLLHLLKTSDVGKAKALLSNLSPHQREALLALR